MGDLNARTANNIDYISNDDDTHIPLNIEYTLDTELKQRHSQDTILDKQGKHLLEICISSQTRILNGRKIGDSIGYNTSHQYNGSSTVDYAICSHTLYHDIPNFKVQQYLGTLSDHCMISFSILTNKPIHNKSIQPKLHELPQTFHWNEHSKTLYQKALKLPTINTQLLETMHDTEHCSDAGSINNLISKLNSVLTKTAEMTLKCKTNKVKKKPKPWLTPNLKNMERNLNKKARIMTQYQTGESRRSFFLALKIYRRERKYAIRHHKNAEIKR